MTTAGQQMKHQFFKQRRDARYKSGSQIFKVAMILVAGLVMSSCTSSNSPSLTASSTHSKLAGYPTQTTDPLAPQASADADQQSPNRPIATTYPDNNTPTPPAQTASNLSAQPASTPTSQVTSVAFQENQQVSAPPQPKIQLASLDPNSYATSGDDRLTIAEPDSPEVQAQKRVDVLYSSMEHGSCKSGWATPPSKLDAKRETAGDPYYMEIRLRNTPLFPVGHTYIAYGRLSPEGKPIDEKLIMLSPLGGYGGAAIAAALPMPGILVPLADDCRIKPHAAYRVTLNAQKFEKMLLRIQEAQKKIPAYALFAYNCNHFVSDIVAPTGILPPKNIYVPAVKYIYAVIEANEGFNPKKRRG